MSRIEGDAADVLAELADRERGQRRVEVDPDERVADPRTGVEPADVRAVLDELRRASDTGTLVEASNTEGCDPIVVAPCDDGEILDEADGG